MKKEKQYINITIGQLWEITDHIKNNEKENIVKEIDTLLKSHRKTMGFMFVKNDVTYSLTFKKVDIDEDTLGLEVIFNNVKFGLLHFDANALDDALDDEESDDIVDYFAEEIIKKAFLAWYETNLTSPISTLNDLEVFDNKITEGLAMLGCGCNISLTDSTFSYTLYRNGFDIINQLVLTDYYSNKFSLMTYVVMMETMNFNTLSSLISQRIIGENIEVKIEEVHHS